MSSLWIAVVVLAVGPQDASVASEMPPADASAGGVSSVAHQAVKPSRTGRELAAATHDALARWAKVTDQQLGLAAAEFIGLYRELQADTKLARSQSQPLLAKLRGRLLAIQHRTEKRVAVAKRLAKQRSRPQSVQPAAEQHAPLAQQGGFGQGFGGQGRGWQGFGGQDNGEQLIELIQQTIAPATWDINGGAGAIYYWRPGHALVIRNRAEVHERVGGLLEQMNRLGR